MIVEDGPAEQLSIRELFACDDIDVFTMPTGAEALEALEWESFDCLVLDLLPPHMSGFDILQLLQDMPSLRDLLVVLFTSKELSPQGDAPLHVPARGVVVKGVESPVRLQDETALFLHRVGADLPIGKQKLLERLDRSDDALVGKKALDVVDGVRNIFALSSVLERGGMEVLSAGTGNEAISIQESTQDLAIVLMDIMMREHG
jgi:CheY-like chemotaxis protein